MHRNQGPVYYGDYLQLPKLLSTQETLSKKHGSECHDETLFIIVHQVYELWFKQILHEMKSINTLFASDHVADDQLGIVISRTQRIHKIQALLLDQLSVMETMTPMDFLEFRDLLVPASGFQSVQFREIEIMMGLNTNNRMQVDREFFLGRLNEADRSKLEQSEKDASLLENLERWLERIPFTSHKKFSFWDEYRKAVDKMLKSDEEIIESNQATLSPKDLAISKENLRLTRETFDSLFDADTYEKLQQEGKRKLSQKATLSALFILLYRDKPLLHAPYQFLMGLMDIDEHFTTWRYRHAIMAHRMLGTKIGTGGSSGHQYLKRAAENNRAFLDLFNLSTFLIPRSLLPVLPKEVMQELDFHFCQAKGD
jgi:tryptophan 2,3-dioxygenase